MIIKLIILDQF